MTKKVLDQNKLYKLPEQNEMLLESCFDEAIEDFCKANKLTSDMFAEISTHKGVILALEKSARRKFEDLCQ